MFANTSIRVLPSWGFVVGIALIAIIAAVIFRRSSTISARVDDMADDNYPKVAAADGLARSVGSFRL